MANLTELWRLVETRPSRTAVMAEWRETAGDSMPAVRPLLRPIDDLATAYPNPRPHGQPMKVVRHADGSIVAIDEKDYQHRLDLKPEDVVLHRLDVSELCATVVRSLSLRASGDRDTGIPDVFNAGYLELAPGDEHPVALVIPRTQPALCEAIRQIILSHQTPFLLLTPTRTCWSAESASLLRKHKATAVPLDECLATEGDRWRADKRWEQFQNAFHDLVVPPSERELFTFRLQGQMWVVTFDGETTYLKDAIGQAYIAHLLANPREQIFAPDLLRLTTEQEALRATGSAGEQADEQTLNEVKQQYRELLVDRAQAEKRNDDAEVTRIQKELDPLTEYLSQVTGLGGRTREASDDADKIRRSITQAIQRTIGWIGEDLSIAARHLTNSIRTGLFISYQPEEDLPWSL